MVRVLGMDLLGHPRAVITECREAEDVLPYHIQVQQAKECEQVYSGAYGRHWADGGRSEVWRSSRHFHNPGYSSREKWEILARKRDLDTGKRKHRIASGGPGSDPTSPELYSKGEYHKAKGRSKRPPLCSVQPSADPSKHLILRPVVQSSLCRPAGQSHQETQMGSNRSPLLNV